MMRPLVPRVVAIAVGLWLIFAPAVLDYGGRAEANDRVIGPLVASLSLVASWELARAVRWLTLPLGMWMLIAPVALWYADVPTSMNSVFCGLVVMAMAPLGGNVSGTFGGGWRALVERNARMHMARSIRG